MSTLTIELDDDAARLAAKAAQAVKQPLEDWLRESICQAAVRTVGLDGTGVVRAEEAGPTANRAKAVNRRISPLHPGAMQPTPDFNTPLEEFSPYV